MQEHEANPGTEFSVSMRSRKANRRTLLGLVTQVERIQQQIRDVGMQYADVKPEVMRALSVLHDNFDNSKTFLGRIGNML